FFQLYRSHRALHSFPTRRSSDLAIQGEIECDEELFESLRDLRKKLADERDVPAYIVFSDVSLRQMARDYPSREEQFSRISGVGRSEEHTSELQSLAYLVCRLLLE